MSDERLRNLRQLIASTHRRWTILQMLEFAGLALLTTSLVLAPILIGLAWKGDSAATFSFIILICSLILGLFRGFFKRPSNVLTALLIDRQCNLAELFSSAWLMAKSVGASPILPSPGTPGEGQGGGRPLNVDPHPSPPPGGPGGGEKQQKTAGNESLLSLADIQAKAIRPSSIRLHRLNARTWLLITLMLALNLALVAMASNRATTKDRLLADRLNSSHQSTQSINEPLVDLALSSPARAVVPKDPDDPNASHIGESNSQKPSTENNRQAAEGTDHKTDHARADGGGNGIATTHEPTSSHPRAGEQPEQSNRTPTSDGKTVTGPGFADANLSPQHQSDHPDAKARMASLQASDSPWQSSSWHTDVSKAQLALSRGQVPPSYRDLLAGYFR